MIADLDAVAAGAAAWLRIAKSGRRCFDDWLDVARALLVGRTEALKAAGTNAPVGSRYNAAIGLWLHDNGLGGITSQERYRALLVLDNLPAIEQWRSGLSEARGRQLNHPGAVWSAWKQATATEPRRQCVRSAKAHGYGKAIHWPPDALRRAATAIREARSIDTFILARRALEAAVRNETDLLALLEPPRKKQSSVTTDTSIHSA